MIAPPGYPGKLYRGKYAYEHRVVWWENTLENPDGFDIHHKNENKRDNIFSNLEKKLHEEHTAEHNRERSAGFVLIECAKCGVLMNKASRFIERAKQAGQKNFFCSKSHSISFNRNAKKHSSVG